ncbi:MAG: hypothetical protein ACM3ST_12735 [Bdellovibrio bacteriovorus]
MVVTTSPLSALDCKPFIEEHADGSQASFRAHANAFEDCPVSEETYRRILGEWLRARSGEPASLRSLSLGRAVAFPWVSRHIADAALRLPNWAAEVSAVRPGRRDALAAAAIRDPALIRRLAAPFEGSSYLVLGLAFEKMLYGRAVEHASRGDAGATLVPFDAQLWLRLAPSP